MIIFLCYSDVDRSGQRNGDATMKFTIATISAFAMFGLSAGANAQSLNDAEAEVWSFVEEAYAEHQAGGTWHEVLHEDGFGWGSADYPMGRDRETIERYAGALGGEGEILFVEMTPVRISLAGDTAIAFYYTNVISTDHKGDRSTNATQCADTLVRTDGEWQFLGWGCRGLGDDD